MKNFLYLIAICIGCWWMIDSCSGDSDKTQSSEQTSAYSSGDEEVKSSGKFKYTVLSDQSSLMGLLDGKTFSGYDDTSGSISFSRGGGDIDGIPFTIPSMQVVSEKIGKFSIFVPGYNLSSSCRVVISDDEITIHDANGSNYRYE